MAGNQNSGRANMPPGPGRPKGMPNKFSATVKEMVLAAIDKRGGQKFFEGLEDRDLVRLAAKLIPQQISGGLEVQVDWATVIEDARARMNAAKKSE